MPAVEKEIFLVSQDDALNWSLTKKLIKKDFTITTSRTVAEGLAKVFETPPALIILHEPLIKGKAFTLLRNFKKDNLFSHIPVTYQIRVQGLLNQSWSDRLGGMTIDVTGEDSDAPVTTLSGRLLDQAALCGVLNTLYDLRLPLLSVECKDWEDEE